MVQSIKGIQNVKIKDRHHYGNVWISAVQDGQPPLLQLSKEIQRETGLLIMAGNRYSSKPGSSSSVLVSVFGISAECRFSQVLFLSCSGFYFHQAFSNTKDLVDSASLIKCTSYLLMQ